MAILLHEGGLHVDLLLLDVLVNEVSVLHEALALSDWCGSVLLTLDEQLVVHDY